MTKATCEPTRYFFGRDDDGHNFLVRADQRDEFTAWLDEVQNGGDPDLDPAIGQRIDGVGAWTFENPEAVR